MIDVYHFQPSREEIAADRRKALWGRFERASSDFYVPPELRPAAIIRPPDKAHKSAPVKYIPSANQARLGSARAGWYAESLPIAINCAVVFGYTPAIQRVQDMKPDDVLVFSAISAMRGKHLRNALIRHCSRGDMQNYAYAINVSRELVRVQCIAKTAPNPCEVGQGGPITPSCEETDAKAVAGF